MYLTSLPDCKGHHQYLTIGNKYTIEGVLGNAYVIRVSPDKGHDINLAILQERFQSEPFTQV